MSTNEQEEPQSSDRGGCCKACCNLPLFCKDRLLAKWADSSTIHGVDHIFSGKSKIRRLLWAFIVLAAIGGCLYTIIDRSIYFHSRPTVTTVTAVPHRDGVTFPSVTICNLSPIRRSYADSHNITEFLRYFLYTDSLLFEDQFRGESCRTLLTDSDDTGVSLTLREVFVNGRFRNDGSFPFIQSCYFGDTHNVTNCLSTLQPMLTPSGLCYTFNASLDSTPVRSVGQRYGLRMVLNISQSEYIQSANSDAGIKVSIHNRHEIPTPELTGISVSPGSHATIALFPHTRSTDRRITDCNPLDFSLEFFPQRSYSASACRLNEYFKKSIELCGCTDIADNIPTSGPYSTARNCTVQDTCCLYDAYIASDQDALNCKPVCDDTTYDPSVSYSQFPSNSAANVISLFSQISTQVLESNILAVNVYLGSLETIVSRTEYSYDVSALFADIGGALALFVGASIISFVELFVLCFDETKRGVVYGEHKVSKKIKRDEHELTEIKEEKDEEKQSVV